MNEAGTSRPCCVFKGESCDLRHEDGSPTWQCAVCQDVAQWIEDGTELVGIRESGASGAVIFPARKRDDLTGALFTLNATISSPHELRRTIHDVLRVADTVWIAQPEQETLLLVKEAECGPVADLPT